MPCNVEKSRESEEVEERKSRKIETEETIQNKTGNGQIQARENLVTRKSGKALVTKTTREMAKQMLECSCETEVLPSEQLQQDFEDLCEVIATEQEQELVANFDLPLVDV